MKRLARTDDVQTRRTRASTLAAVLGEFAVVPSMTKSMRLGLSSTPPTSCILVPMLGGDAGAQA